MTKFYITSDLHLDSLVPYVFGGTHYRPNTNKARKLAQEKDIYFQRAINALFVEKMFRSLPPADSEGVLILAGDIWTGHRMFSFHGVSWIAHVCSLFKHVIVVQGNHDAWGTIWGTWHTKAERLRKEQGLDNLHILEKSYVDIDGVRIIGATLWTDMHKHDPLAILDSTRVMNDFRFIRKFTPEKWLREHTQSVDYIKHVLGNSEGIPCIVATHHTPCYQSVSWQYKGNGSNAYYYSDLTHLMFDRDNLKVWAHGHLHSTSDYMIDNTRIVCYPVGYENRDSNYVVVEI